MTRTPLHLMRRLYYRLFKRYRVLERVMVHYRQADRMLCDTAKLPEPQRWIIDIKREDANRGYGWVHLLRRERISQ